MKGIAHFITGVAAASFFPWAVDAAAEGNPLYFVLGGAFGVLPDTLDFKFYRFFYRHDVTVDPDPARFDPNAIAAALADAVRRAREEQRTIRVKLNTVRRGPDHWQQYQVRFDADRREAQVRAGPVVNTGQTPLPGSAPAVAAVGRAPLAAEVAQTYDAVTTVDIFDGPTFAFEPGADGRVTLHFLPWHRNWSHSFPVGAGWALLAWPLLGARAAPVILAAYAGHLLEDQLGFMGSNLFFPITRKRFAGAHWMRSGDAWPNFATVWLCGLLIFWNLARRSADPSLAVPLVPLLLFGGLLPIGLTLLALRLLQRRAPAAEAEPIDQAREWGDPLAG